MKFFYHFGKYVLLLRSLFVRPEKFSMYWKETLRQMTDIGVGSIGIIAIISLFIGAVTAIQFAYQLKGNIVPMWWIGIIVRDSMILELAPTISCLLLAGKVGSNISSELGTMRITEQIDALEIMGVSTPAYLIGPKLVGALIVVPILVIISVFLGILGGLLSGVMSGIFTSAEYQRGVQYVMDDFNITVMFIKSFTFSFLITTTSCYQGFNVRGGALEIGRASTRAVVYSSILVIVANFLIAFFVL